MKIAICDDSITDRCIILEYLQAYMTKQGLHFEIHEYERGETLIDDYMEGIGYDIIFLDIFMDGSLGLDTAKKLRAEGAQARFVFSTATSEFAIACYDVDASGYLLKPLSYEKFCNVLDRIIPKIQQEYYRIQVRSSVYHIPIHEILYVESQNNKCIIYCSNGREYTVYKKLSTLHEELEKDNFLRCHQSYIVNMDYITKAEKWFVLHNGVQIPIRQKNRSDLKKIFINYISGGETP